MLGVLRGSKAVTLISLVVATKRLSRASRRSGSSSAAFLTTILQLEVAERS